MKQPTKDDWIEVGVGLAITAVLIFIGYLIAFS